MIEINIPEQAAVNLLTDQVNLELKRQKKIGLQSYDTTLDSLDEQTLKKIVEISLFDILVLLPVTLITEESNLPQIISKAVRAFSENHLNEYLSNYNENEAKSILSQIKKPFGDFGKTTTFQNN